MRKVFVKKNLVLCQAVLLFCLFSGALHAEQEEAPREQLSESTIPEDLDVDERDAEMSRLEITPYVGTYLGDTLQNSFLLGGVMDARISPYISLGGEFGWTRIAFDHDGTFGSGVTNRNLYLFEGVLTFNIPAAFLSRGSVVETDFFTTIGGGITRVNSTTRGNGFIGGGMKIYSPADWFGVRIEVRNYFSSLKLPDGRTDFTSDWTVTVGPTFMIPPRLF